MASYTLQAAAKINLYLEILGDRPDGYHELAMVMQSVGLSDRIDIRSISTDTIRIQCNHPAVPTDASNLAYRAVELVTQKFPDAMTHHGGVEVVIDKHIPVGAGLAGGSADAAAVLVGLDLLWKLGLTQSELQELGAQLGSDIPFCIAGGLAIATGRGEKLAALPSPNPLHLVLAKHRHISVPTGWAYQTFRKQFGDRYIATANATVLTDRWQRVHSGPLVRAVTQGDVDAIRAHLHNDFERIVFPTYPPVAKLRQCLADVSSIGALMSGSGSTVFALARSRAEAEAIQAHAQNVMADPDLDFWITEFVSAGVQLC